MSKSKKTAAVEAPPAEKVPGLYATMIAPLPNEARAVVSARCLDGGDVELTVNGESVSFEDGIILRWGRKRG